MAVQTNGRVEVHSLTEVAVGNTTIAKGASMVIFRVVVSGAGQTLGSALAVLRAGQTVGHISGTSSASIG